MTHSNLKNLFIMAFPYSILMFLTSCLGINNDIKNRPENSLTAKPKTSMYDIKVNTIDGKPFDLNSLKGKKLLIVNTASKCGYTPQYEELQELNIAHGDSLIILGFPCNDFGGQEPGTQAEIATFCTKNYGVTFQMFEKVHVKGKEQHPLYTWLTSPELNGWNKETPSWNFCKYLISENGELLNYFGSSIKPMNKVILDAIKK
ncbi:glutathione peroxidase [uncultured Cytophaga sp.]|uniref:glutathione peroxidase n=1 Tax=uncultured Cytophaga sp. TaxID=160238 RepID=UPI002614B514|nr:glutathione peroxidase [uncultured Cytophaga sp.]